MFHIIMDKHGKKNILVIIQFKIGKVSLCHHQVSIKQLLLMMLLIQEPHYKVFIFLVIME